MNIGGNPGPDDYGLPPVDIEIPDDARELDSDVHAYHRELRVQRRRTLTRRLRAPLVRDGMILPVLACCLALTLLTGTLLTLFTTQDSSGVPGSGAARGTHTAAPGHVGGPLPNANVLVGGEETPLRALNAAVLEIVSPTCRCAGAVGRLTRQAEAVGAQPYVVGIEGAQVTGLARQAGLRATHAVEDPTDVMVTYYHPAGFTAVLVRADGIVAAVLPVRGHSAQLAQALRALPSGAAPQGLGDGPRATGGTLAGPLAAGRVTAG